ncbi:hypothetical protein SISSUDRAFT_981301 [Sistotremastrum suecicum HHB10207 ss-3]|uniref:CoA-dependent acyltransferase n=1 Tax=Sistotremastrum suecicum HHB10207 ss-3 TaxID=1314776 RepID=A0A166GMI6_9AGAM|nr:hypothetical protein SISSUDRAFT_981301 [Sistotremastrum suecicum HHB10207 ss-3]
MPKKLTASPEVYSRPLAHSELSYFLPSREDGVNDMYLHLGFKAPAALVTAERVLEAWTVIRGRHPLLASTVKMDPWNYEHASFVYTPPISPEAAIAEARNSFSFGHASKDILIDSFLNGPRTLHPGHLSHLFLSADPYVSSSENSTRKERFDLLICATHYLADLTAVHMIADELFTLLVSCPLTPSPATPNSIYAVLAEEFTNRNVEQLRGEWEALPSPLEHRIPVTSIGKFRSAVHKLDYARSQSRLIGGHAFPRAVGSEDRKHTVLLQASFTNERTKAILKQCKANGVTVNNCLFALCGLSWSKINGDKTNDLPLMMYSACNMRAHCNTIPEGKQKADDSCYLAIGYFNIVLPSFLPSDPSSHRSTFWHRAKSVKTQCRDFNDTPFMFSRAHLMAAERGNRAKVWAKEDDEKAAGIWSPPPKPAPSQAQEPKPEPLFPKAPSKALLGLSLLGNLDPTYNHELYKTAGLTLESLTTGPRQRRGGMLLYGYTFAGKLWLMLSYDENAFDKATVKAFWDGIIGGLGEYF